MGLSVMQTIQPASTTLRYLSANVWRSFSMSSELRLGVWSSTWKIFFSIWSSMLTAVSAPPHE